MSSDSAFLRAAADDDGYLRRSNYTRWPTR
jgi:hypothetical protein